MPFMGHHIWCNRNPQDNPDKCDMCTRLKEMYPEDGVTPDELIQRHFPDTVKHSTPEVPDDS